jgi:hypothetical protein
MNAEYSIVLTAYQYNVLKKNPLISTACTTALNSATKHPEGVELLLTLISLTDLIGFVAAEANHAKTLKQSYDLNEICDYLEELESDIKNDLKNNK